MNQFNNTNFLFKGKPLPQSMDITKVCKIISANSDDFITIKTLETSYDTTNLGNSIDENDIKALGNGKYFIVKVVDGIVKVNPFATSL